MVSSFSEQWTVNSGQSGFITVQLLLPEEIPSGAKARRFLRFIFGPAEAVPCYKAKMLPEPLKPALEDAYLL
jgi:hypothetical protein